MEQNKNSIIGFIAQTLILFAVNILALMLLATFFGEGAKLFSSLYQFGSKGLATTTMLQFLLGSASVIALKNIFFSEKLFKKMMALWRTVLMLFCVLLINILYIYIFDWFSFENGYAWAGFIICFAVGFLLSSIFMVIKTKLESSQYDELLTHYKKQREGDHDNE